VCSPVGIRSARLLASVVEAFGEAVQAGHAAAHVAARAFEHVDAARDSSS
jgi:hypothetical protein